MNNDRELLLRYLEGSLEDVDEQGVERRLATDERLRAELLHLRSIRSELTASRAEGFGAFFAERTLNAWRPKTAEQVFPLYDALRWVFVRTAFAGLALVILLSVLNVLDYQGLDVASSWFEAAFGLPSTTVEDAFATGVI